MHLKCAQHSVSTSKKGGKGRAERIVHLLPPRSVPASKANSRFPSEELEGAPYPPPTMHTATKAHEDLGCWYLKTHPIRAVGLQEY